MGFPILCRFCLLNREKLVKYHLCPFICIDLEFHILLIAVANFRIMVILPFLDNILLLRLCSLFIKSTVHLHNIIAVICRNNITDFPILKLICRILYLFGQILLIRTIRIRRNRIPCRLCGR